MSIVISRRERAPNRPDPPSATGMQRRPGIGALFRSPRPWLAMRHRVRRPLEHRNSRLRFADGTEEFVFRETVVEGLAPTEPCVLVVAFRLRLLGRAGLGHALFRRLSIVNTPLFAGFPGFTTKLWLADAVTGEYRGVTSTARPVVRA